MIICLDVGNSHIYGGIFADERIIMRFRHLTNNGSTSDQLGVFLKNLLRESDIDPREIKNIAIGSVVPSIDYTLRAACKKYFNIEPFILRGGVKTGIKIKTHNQQETGADLIASCIAAAQFYANRNMVLIDLGTATTLTALSADKEFLGVSILPGLRISMEALEDKTAKLFPVEIQKPEKIIGRTTTESIQSGLYYGHLGSIKEIIRGITQEAFANKTPLIIGTGGFVHLFEKENIFNVIDPDLVLHGLRLALELNNLHNGKSEKIYTHSNQDFPLGARDVSTRSICFL